MLGAPWFIALIAFLVNSLVAGWMIMGAIKTLPKPQPVAVVEPPTKFTEPPPPLWSFRTDAIQELVVELKENKEGMISEHKELAAIQAQVSSEKQELERVKQELIRLREDLDKRVVEIQDFEVKNLKTLSQTYSTMLPPAAAAIFRELDEDTVVKILALMKTERVALLLGELAKPSPTDRNAEESPAKRAARISDKLRLMKSLKKEVPQ